MYLMGLVNSTLVARRPTDHVELVDLSVEKKKAQERYNKALANGPRSSRPVASLSPRRRQALETQVADLCMEPLFPLFLTSGSSDSSDGGAVISSGTETKPVQEAFVTEMEKTEKHLEDITAAFPHQELSRGDVETMPVNVVKKTKKNLDDAASRLQELSKRRETKHAGQSTKVESKSRVAPKLGRVLSDGGVSTRVQRHPLEAIQEQEQTDEQSVRGKIDCPGRVLLHPLERIDEDAPKNRKAATKKERKPVAPSPQPSRKFAREPKVDVKPPPKGRERAKPPATITKAKSATKPVCEIATGGNDDGEKPSLANPVMEKMEGLASPEPPYSWDKTKLPKLAVSSVHPDEPLMEERELRYSSSPKMTESDTQDELSFRVWERESITKRKLISVSSDFQDLDLETLAQHSTANQKENSLENNVKQIPEQLSPLRTLRQTSTPKPVDVETQQCDEEIHHECPSPSSFTCGLSPTSLFSDDDNIFSRFQQFPEFGETATTTTTFCKSPRSVLAQEPDKISSHFASSTTYNDESSDLESPAGPTRPSFSTFTYTNKEMELTTSEDDPEETRNDRKDEKVDISDLQYFQEANRREPWLGKGGGVLDDTDLQFLLPPETTTTTSIPISQPPDSEISEESATEDARKPKCHDNWMPCNDTTTTTTTTRRRHSRSSSFSKSKETLHPPRPSRRSVKFASELVHDIPHSSPSPKPTPKSIRLPRPESPNPNPKDEDEGIYPSVKSWEVKEEINASTSSPSRRRWRKSLNPKPTETPNPKSECEDVSSDSTPAAAASDMPSSRRRWRRSREENVARCSSRRQRVAQILPCAGRLFSWPQRLAFKVSRSRHVAVSDDESVASVTSFGRSARRDAQQVRRILKGSQKQFSNLTAADILKDSFQSQ